MSGTSSQKRGFHTMRRVTPISRPTTEHKRNLYIKQFQAFDILKQKSILVDDTAASSDSSISVSITVDRMALSPCIIASPTSEFNPAQSQKFPFPYNQTKLDSSIITAVASHLSLPDSSHEQLSGIVQALWEIYKEKEAFTLETRIGISTDGTLEIHAARFGFDDAAFRSSGRQEDIHKLRNKSEEVPEEVEAEKDGIVYVKYVQTRTSITSEILSVSLLTSDRLEGEGSIGTLGMYSSLHLVRNKRHLLTIPPS